MKLKLLIILTTILLISCTEKDSVKNQAAKNEIPPINKSLALKPPMGWNSWDCLGWGATEIEVKAVADYMAKNLKYLGYEYIVIDMLWYGDEAASDFEAFVHETIPVRPNYNLDEYGRLLPETDFQTMTLLTNEEALAVNRNSINPRQIKFKNAIVIWASDIPDTEDKYLAFFNQWESKEPINIKVQFKDLGLPSETEFNVRDLWVKKDLGVFKNSFGALIPAHGAGLYRIFRK